MATKGTRWAELDVAARAMPPKEWREQLAALARDERFAAVVAWLQTQEAGWSAAVADQARAAQHGQLAHAAGSLFCVQTLLSGLRGIIEPPQKPPTPGD
jgi:hypothetical protein